MKRLIALAMSAVMMLSLTACAGGSEASSSAPEGSSAVAEERAAVRVGGLKGPTAMGDGQAHWRRMPPAPPPTTTNSLWRWFRR